MLMRKGRAAVRLALLCCLPLALGMGAALADARPVMNWTVTDLPPGSMPVNGQLTDGIYDAALKLVWDEWPEVQHQITVANAGRAMQRVSEGLPTCFSGAVRTPERDKVGYYTATHLVPALKLVTTQAKAHSFQKNARGEVLPANTFGREDLRGLVLAHRSYTPVIDALLGGGQPHAGVHSVVSADGGGNVLQMIARDRADYTLTYDHSLTYQLRQQPDALTHAGLVALPLAGTEPVVVGIYCPRNEWGREAITRIDAILARVSQTARYQESAERWYTPETLRQHKAAQAAFYKRRAKPSDPASFR